MTEPAPNSAESPWPVRTVARKIAEWVDRLGAVWVEGQLAQVTARPGTGTAFLVLRDPAADVSLQLTAPIGLVRDGGAAVAEGNRVVVHGKPSFFLGRGTLSLRVDDDPRGRDRRAAGPHRAAARAAGGRGPLRRAPASGRLPFLPGCIGLVTGRASAAEHDVVSQRDRPLARGPLPARAHRGAGRAGRAADRRGARGARPRPGGRRHRARPRRRQRRGPAAVLRRDAVPGRRRVPHPGGLGDRARAGHPAGRPRRGPALLDPDRGRPPAGPGPRRGDRPGSPALRDRPGGRWPAGWTARSGCSRRCGTGPVLADPLRGWTRGTPRSSGCATPPGRASSAAWTRRDRRRGASRRAADDPGSGGDAGAGLRGRAAGARVTPRGRRCPCCARRTRRRGDAAADPASPAAGAVGGGVED